MGDGFISAPRRRTEVSRKKTKVEYAIAQRQLAPPRLSFISMPFLTTGKSRLARFSWSGFRCLPQEP